MWKACLCVCVCGCVRDVSVGDESCVHVRISLAANGCVWIVCVCVGLYVSVSSNVCFLCALMYAFGKK